MFIERVFRIVIIQILGESTAGAGDGTLVELEVAYIKKLTIAEQNYSNVW